MYKISYKRKNNINRHKLPLKAFTKNNKFQKQLNINQFNIIELNEEELTQNYEPNINLLSENEILKLKKKATLIENYYSNKSEEANINENCFNCLMNNFKPNELLYFTKRKDLLSYLKYCFYFLNNILFLDKYIYLKNRYDLDKCKDPNFLSGWRFFIPKTVCRACFLRIINKENLFLNLKKIFTDIDGNSTSNIVYRVRRPQISRARKNNYLRRKIALKMSDINTNGNEESVKNNDIDGKEKNKIKFKNNKSLIKISKNRYNAKNRLIPIKEYQPGNIEQNGKYYINKFNNENQQASRKEKKIKTSEFIKNENEEKNKNIEITKKEEDVINKDNQIINYDHSDIKQNSNSNYLLNETSIINPKKFNNNEKEKELKEINNNKVNKINLYKEILNIKHMYNGLVIKLHFKLNSFKELLFYTIINIGDFKEKLYNSMHFNPEIISFGVNRYEQYFTSLYNEGFKAKKDYEEMFTVIKNESIPSIEKNILKLKEEKLDDDGKKNLDEIEHCLKEYSEKIHEMIIKYEESMDNFFTNFFCFFNLMKELKTTFSQQTY